VLWQAPPPAPPPPLAFRTATLQRAAHGIDVEMLAVTEVPVRVTITRAGVRIGRGTGVLERGSTAVRVRIGPKSMKPLRPGLHVALRIEYGASTPLHARPALLLGHAGPETDAPRAARSEARIVVAGGHRRAQAGGRPSSSVGGRQARRGGPQNAPRRVKTAGTVFTRIVRSRKTDQRSR
jgi:hypothetical protein